MSQDSSRNTSSGECLKTQDPSVKVSQDEGECDEDVSNTSRHTLDPQQVERVIKEVGTTSTAFIGPALPPALGAAKTAVEDSLSEFYKELEEIDAQNAAGASKGARPGTSSDVPDSSRRSRARKKAGEEKQPLRSHWSENAPYPPRRPPADDRPDASSAQKSWRHHQPLNGSEMFHPPPPGPPPPPFMLNHWGPPNTNQYPPSCPPPPRFPPPNHFSHCSQGFYNDPPRHFQRDFYDDSCGRSRRADGEFREHQDFGAENDIWERRHHSPPPCFRVLILMRGLPGSGKSTRARELCTGPSGLILSTDDYFDNRDGYRYDAGLLGAAHKWNQDRAREAMREGRTPIIIDNTNIQAWEMKPYVRTALDHGYRVDFCEPDTSWKFDLHELEKRNTHGVDRDKIAQMLDRFSSPISVSVVMNSQDPQHVKRRREHEQHEQHEQPEQHEQHEQHEQPGRGGDHYD